MRWGGIAVLLLLHLMTPVISAGPIDSAREGEIVGIAAPSEAIVHPNETVSTYITLHNLLSVNQELTVAVNDMPAVLTAVNLPLSEVLVPNHLKQLAFGITADASAGYTTHQVEFSVTSDYDSSFLQSVWMNVTVAPYSNLKFGSQGVTELTVDEKVRTGVAVNITNNASFADNVTFDLYSQSGWNWGWSMDTNDQGNAYLNLETDSLSYVYLWVDVPAVIDGAPLEGTGPRFTLTGISGLDRQTTSWAFDLLMNEKRNVSIDEFEENIELAPGEDGRLNVTVRNVGNIPNRVNITLQGLDMSGNPLTGYSASDRFNYSGWTVALFGGLEDIDLLPNESRTIEIGIQSPVEFSGEMNVEVQVFANGAEYMTKTVRVGATINRTTNATLTSVESGCMTLKPDAPCASNITVVNTGNSYNTFSLRVGKVTDEFSAIVPQNSILVQANQEKTFSAVYINVRNQTLAFTQGEVELELIDDTGSVLNTVTIQVRAAPIIQWSLGAVQEDIGPNNRLSVVFEVRNDGNAIDGFVVQLQSSHSVSMGLIPPDGAVYEEDVQYPRSFQLNGVPLGSNVTLRAWIDLPTNQTSNGTVYINTTITSIFEPEGQMFVCTSKADYIGTKWQNDAIEEGRNWGELGATAWAYTKAWSGVIFAIIFSGVIIYKALIVRQQRLDDKGLLPYQDIKTDANDWMKQYATEAKPQETVEITTAPQQVSKDEFAAVFRRKSGKTTPAQEPVNEELRVAASLILDVRSEQATLQKADVLLEQIQTGAAAKPHPSNESLPLKEHQPSLTVRNDPHGVMPQAPQEVEEVAQVPLPPVDKPSEDDLEF